MPYVVTPLTAKAKQITYEDILDDVVDMDEVLRSRALASKGNTSTRTYYFDEIPARYYRDLELKKMVDSVSAWNRAHEELFQAERKSLYAEFRIPK